MKETLETLKKYFQFDQFLEAQEEIVTAIMEGRDTLVIKPTGGGKSLCYQLPALMREGLCLVVSPLIALMKDQVDVLQARGIAATQINSTLNQEEYQERLEAMSQGKYKLVYVAPERFRAAGFLRRLQEIKISFIAVDEAHCLSQWGHDFRPDYLRMGQTFLELGQPQVAAFTATATPEVKDDILQHLHMREPAVFVAGFARKNLRLEVHQVGGEAEKLDRIVNLVRKHKVGIVYCATRKKVDAVSALMKEEKVSFVSYHGGMGDTERTRAQEEFMRKEVDVAVATNAFGMGIDRSDIRFVAHYQMPGSVEAFYQEAGRAGRDGLPAVCEMLFNYADTQIQEFFIEGANPSLKLIHRVFQELRDHQDEQHEVRWNNQELIDRIGAGVNPMAVNTAVTMLARHQLIERFDIPGERTRGTRIMKPKAKAGEIQIDPETLREKEKRDRAKLQALIKMGYSQECRQAWIRKYFGETNPEDCGNCDVCCSDRHQNLTPLTPDQKGILLKALSGVARACRRAGETQWEPIFGKGKIIQMLVGSQAQGITNTSLVRVSTFGILKAEGAPFLQSLFREMEMAGLVATSDGEYPTLYLTEKGHRVMMGHEEVPLCWPDTPRNAKSSSRSRSGKGAPLADDEEPLTPEQAELFSRLKELRLEIAKEEKVPAFVVLTDRTLRALAREKPRSLAESTAIPGIGAQKAQRYLQSFLDEIHGAF